MVTLKQNSPFLRWFLYVLIGSLLLGAGGYWGYDWLKTFRAQSMMSEAEEMLDAGAKKEAVFKITASHQLQPESVKILKEAAELLSEARRPESLYFWKKLQEKKQLSTAQLKTYAESTLRYGEKAKALSLAERVLEATDQQDPSNHPWAVNLAQLAGKHEKAIKWAQRGLSTSDLTRNDQLHLAKATLQATAPKTYQQGIKNLKKLAKKDDTAGKRARLLLAKETRIPQVTRLDYLKNYSQEPLTSLPAFLEAQSLRINMFPEEKTEIVEETFREAPKYASEDSLNAREKASLGRWLNRHSAHAQVLELIHENDMLDHQDLFAIRMDALAQLNRWDAILDKLSNDANIPISGFTRHLYLFRAHTEIGNEEIAQSHWDRALLPGSDVSKRRFQAGNYAEKLSLYEYARQAYRQLARNPNTAERGYALLMRVARKENSMKNMKALLKQMQEEYPHNKRLQNDVNYYHILEGKSFDQTLQKAFNLYQESPNTMAYRITLAFGLLRSGKNEKAYQLIHFPDLDWSQYYPHWQIVAALTMKMNDKTKQLNSLLENMRSQSLLSEERALLRSAGIEI